MKFYRRLNTIKVMSFDLDDTLYDNGPNVRKAEAWLQQHLRETYPKLPFLEAMDWLKIRRTVLATQPELAHDLSHLRIAVLELFFKNNGYEGIVANELANNIFKLFLAVRSDFVVPTKSLQVLTQIATKMPVIAITNGNVDTDAIGLTSYFSRVIKSSVEYRMKPAADMFDLAAKQIQIPKQHILHVGDHLISDVSGAVSNDLMAAWFNPANKSLASATKMAHLPDIELSDLDELLSLL